MKEEISLDIEMSKEEMAKIKELLTSLPELRHYAFQLKNGEYLDLVEYKDYEKLEEENKSLQSQLKAKEEVITKLKQWLEEEKPTKDMNENFIIIRLSDLKAKIQELEILSKGEKK